MWLGLLGALAIAPFYWLLVPARWRRAAVMVLSLAGLVCRTIPQLRRDVEAAVREGRLGYEESGRLLRFYEEGLHGYTYLEDAHER